MSFLKSNNTAGGLAKLFILRLAHYQGVRWVAEYGTYFLNDVSSYLEPLYFTQDTGNYQVKYKNGAYEVSINTNYPGYSQSFEELECTPFLLLGLTHNNEYLLFGDANNYFIYDHNQDSGSDFSDLASTKFELKRNMMLKPRLIIDPFSFELSDPVNVIISGVFGVGETLIASFTAATMSGPYETVYQWYIADDANGTDELLVQSGDSSQYIIELADWGKYIRVAVQLFSQSSESTVGTSPYYFVEVLDNQFYLCTNVFDIILLDEATNHYLFTGTNHGVSGSFDLFSPARAFTVKAFEHLYMSFDYKVNADTFYDITGWPAQYFGPASLGIGRLHSFEVDSSEINTWIKVSGYISTNQDFDSYIITTGIVDSIPPEVSLEVRNFKCWKVES